MEYPPNYEIKKRINAGELDRALLVLVGVPNMTHSKLASHHITNLVEAFAAENFTTHSKELIERAPAFFKENYHKHQDCA